MKFLILFFFSLSAASTSVPYWYHVGSVVSLPHRTHLCDATQLQGSYFITTASCVICKSKCDLAITLGSRDGLRGVPHNITDKYIHPQYRSEPDLHNLAVVKIGDFPIGMANTVNTPSPIPGQNGSIYVWKFSTMRLRYFLTEVPATVVADSVCTNAGVRLLGTEFCVMTEKLSHIGPNDEAASLISYRPSYQVLGVYAYKKHARDALLFAFLDVSKFGSWIKEVVQV